MEKYVISICLALMTLTVCRGQDAAKSDSTAEKPALEQGKITDIPLLARVVTVDGKIDSGEWEGALQFSDFRDIYTGTALLKTEAWVGRTETELYFAFRCFHDQPALMLVNATAHDGNLWEDDSVEIFLDTRGARSDYYQFIANAKGILFDQYCPGNSEYEICWNPGASAAGSILPDGYSVEIKVPITALNLCFNPIGIVFLNMCRNIPYLKSNQTLFGGIGGYHNPSAWQAFRIPGPELAAEYVKWRQFAGDNETVMKVRNLTKTAVAVTGSWEVVQGNEKRVEPVKLDMPGEGTGELPLRYSFIEGANVSLDLRLCDAKGHELMHMNRIFKPRTITASAFADSDILLRGEPLGIDVKLFIEEAELANYSVKIVVLDSKGTEICARETGITSKGGCFEVMDLAKVPADVSRLEATCVITERKTGREVYRTRIPIQLVTSPLDL